MFRTLRLLKTKTMDVIHPEAAIINNTIPGQQCAPIGGVWIEGQKIHRFRWNSKYKFRDSHLC